VSRAQLMELGVEPHEVRRWQRRRELARLHEGVYVDHTGLPTWNQRAWGAVLSVWPAALGGESALRAAEGPGRGDDTGPVHVVVDRSRKLAARPGVAIQRTFDLERRALWNVGPPRLRYEEAVLDLAMAARGEFAAVGALAKAVQKRHTTAPRIATALATRSRARRRHFLLAVLRDVGSGTCSVLEHAYLSRVERPHDLPTARRQLRGVGRSGAVYRDAAYGDLLVELDGRLFHDTAEQRDADFDRDLDAAVEGATSVRLSWGQVIDRPCATAYRVSRLLGVRGWPPGRPCGPGCSWDPITDRGRSVSPGDSDRPRSSGS